MTSKAGERGLGCTRIGGEGEFLRRVPTLPCGQISWDKPAPWDGGTAQSPEAHSEEMHAEEQHGKRPWKRQACLGRCRLPSDKSFEYRKGPVPGKFCLISSSKVAKFSHCCIVSRGEKNSQGCTGGDCFQVLLPQLNFLGRKQHVISRPERSFSPASSKKGTRPAPAPAASVWGKQLPGMSVRRAGFGNHSRRKQKLSGKKVLLGLVLSAALF